MGGIMDEMCCNPHGLEMDETGDFLSSERGNDSEGKKLSNIKIRKVMGLPSSEMFFSIPNINPNIDVDSLTKLPIRTLNIIRKNLDKFIDSYEVIKEIGEGSYGNVFKVKSKKTGDIRALKIIEKDCICNRTEELCNEVKILRTLDHINIIKLYEFFEEPNYFGLISEFCNEGDLQKKINKIKKFPEFIVKIIMYQIFKALVHLNSRGIIHGDVKLENIMIDNYLEEEIKDNKDETNSEKINEQEDKFINAIVEDSKKFGQYKTKDHDLFKGNDLPRISAKHSGNVNFTNISFQRGKSVELNRFTYNDLKINNFGIKLIDFGSSKFFYKYKNVFNDLIGTPLYSSPEVIKNDYNALCDIWSCGVMMYKLLSGKFPFNGNTIKETVEAILKGKFEFEEEYFTGVSDLAKDLIEKCLNYDVSKRITATDALNHPFFRDVIEISVFSDEEKKILTNLKIVNKRSKFYQLILTYLAYNFKDKMLIYKLSKIFYKIDIDSDGKVNKENLLRAYKLAGIEIKEQDIENIINSVDFDNNGYMEYQEFIRICLPRNQLFTEENLKIAFGLLDIDKNGLITISEIADILGINDSKGNTVNKKLIDELSQELDDVMDYETFKEILSEISNN